MENILCPHCGSPVMVHGSRWECGWCGDFGDISSLHSAEQEKIYRAASHTALGKLEEGVLSVLKGIQKHFGEEENERLLACKMAVYGMSHALLPAENRSKTNLWLLRTFFESYSFCTAEEVWDAALCGKAAFVDQFLLTKEQLGSFWETLLPELPHYEPYKAWPDWLFETVDGLSQVESVFSGEDSSGLFDTYQEALDTHWSTYQVRHPDRTALEDALRRWDFSENEWICRDLLIAAFPSAASRWTAAELLDMETMDFLVETGKQDPDTAVRMMKLLLDTVEDHLQEPEATEQLLGNDLYDLCQDRSVQPTLLEQLKKDDRLAQQLFGSAYVGTPQEGLIEACDYFDERMLKERLQEILEQNPYLKDFN